MASTARRGHLDATAGREVVYCHACENEWYHDEHGLECPRCESEATEIVSPDNDPREIHHGSSLSDDGGTVPGLYHYGHDTDSDPEEADIEEHVRTGPGGFVLRERVFRSPARPSSGPPGAGRRGPIDPSDGDLVLHRFGDMLANDLGFRQSGPPGRSGPETLFPPAPGTYRSRFDGMPTTVRRTNFSGPGFSGGTASFTIVSGPGGRLEGPGGMDFNSVFANLMATVVPPPGGVRAGGDPTGVPPAQRAFPPSLQQLLSALLNPANAIHGDAVYSQEALDRIITSLMEANPQSNAAPPASQSAIENLQRKPLDDEMLGPEGRAECIICIDNMNKGDLVVVLPCKHWFHEECVVLWLKEHNTCPICRQAIEGNGTARGDNNNNAPQQQPQQPRQPQPPRPPYTSPYESQGPSRPPFTSPYEPQGPPRPPFTSPYESQGSSRPGQPAHRSHSQNEARLAAIRAAGGRDQHGGGQMRRASLSPPSPFQQRSRSGSEPRDPEQERPYDNPYQSPYESPYSRPRREPYEEHHGGSGRTGQNQGSRRENSTQDQDQGGGGSHNPLSWIRDQFSRHSGGGSGGGRH